MRPRRLSFRSARLPISRPGLLRAERLEQHTGRVDLAAGPTCPTVEKIRARHAEQQDRRVTGKIRHVLDQIEERLLTPVHIVEDTDDRCVDCNRLEQLAKRPPDLLT